MASPLGHAYTAVAGAGGQYRIEGVPPGRYVPIAGKRGYDDTINQTCVSIDNTYIHGADSILGYNIFRA